MGCLGARSCAVFILLSFQVMAQTISTIAGTGAGTYSGDGGQAVDASLYQPRSVEKDKAGNLYIADMYNHRVRRVATDGRITTVAGDGEAGYSGDGGLAINAKLQYPRSVTFDSQGNLYIADMYNHRVRRVDLYGNISTIVGDGTEGSSGDGGPALQARVTLPACVAFDLTGNLYIAEHDGHRIRKVDTHGTISTVAGTGQAGYSGDGGLASKAMVNTPNAVWADSAGILYIADTENNRIRRIDSAGVITTIAGTGAAGYLGDGGTALSAQLHTPRAVIGDNAGTLYISDSANNVIRAVDAEGRISTIAGTGVAGYLGDGGPAAQARLSGPRGIYLDSALRLYVGDADNNRVRVIQLPDTRPAITFAGNAAGFQANFASAGWFYILGKRLSKTTRIWTGADFTGIKLPLSVDGVQVKVNGKAAPIYYVSPDQINALAPDDETVGNVSVEVTNAQGASPAFVAQKAAYSPALFLYSGTQIAIAQALDYTLLGPPEPLAGIAVRAARPGETVILWGTGFGITNPRTSALEVSPATPLAQSVRVRVGGVDATVLYAGLVSPGLCQINVVIPAGVSGTLPIVAEVGGVSSPTGFTITVRP